MDCTEHLSLLHELDLEYLSAWESWNESSCLQRLALGDSHVRQKPL